MDTKTLCHLILVLCCCCFVGDANGVVMVTGDAMIVGMFSIHEPSDGECSARVDINAVMNAEAAKWYIQNLNQHAGLDIKVGLEAYDTCRSKHNAGHIGIEVISRAINGETIAGVLGPQYSSEAGTVSTILSNVHFDYQMALVGYSSTAARLGDVTKYPNYVRVIPNDEIQVQTMLQSMVKLEWNRIAILYEDDVYGTEATELLKTKAMDEGICISSSHQLSVTNGVNVDEVKDVLWDVLLGEGSRPAVNGIVFIVASATVKTLFQLIESLDISSFPIIMLSEGFGLDESVFSRNGRVQDASKGLYAVSPPFIEVPEFSEHWKSIFTSSENFNREVATNPWLQDVYKAISNCGQENCSFNPRTNDQLTTDFGEKSLFVPYTILGAHALVKSTEVVRQTLCQGLVGNCSEFYDQFLPRHVLTSLKNMNLNMETDFAWSIPSINDFVATIDGSGEITFPADASNYEFFNFRATSEDATDFKLTKIGDFRQAEMEIIFDDIRDYDSLGTSTRWPNVRKAQCLPSKICSECIPLDDLKEAAFFEEGDIYIVGVAPIFQKVGNKDCGEIRATGGYQMLESMRFAVNTVNAGIGEYGAYFSGVKIGIVVLNSCSNPAVVQRKIFDLHHSGVTLSNGTMVDLQNKIIGYIAEYTSTTSISIAEVLSTLRFVQISYASTSPALSNRHEFPYFMRVVTPDDAQAMLMVDMMIKLNVTYAQIVYSTGAYGEGGHAKVIENAKTRGVCIIQSIALDEDENVYSVYERLRKYAHAKVVLFFLYPNVLVRLTQALVETMRRGEFVFIGSETWARMPEILQADTDGKLLGSFTVSLEMYQDKALKTYMQSLTPQPFSNNPWVTMYLQKKMNCYFGLSFDKSQSALCSPDDDFRTDPNFILDTYDTTVYVASLTLLAGANAFLKSTCAAGTQVLCKDFTDNPRGLVNELLKVKMDLDGSGDKIKVFNSNGDGNIGYRIYNIQKDETNPQKLTYTQVGRYPLEGTFTFELDHIVYPTHEKFVSQCPNELACNECIDKKENPYTGTKEEKKLDIGVLVLGVLFGLAVVTIIILTVFCCRLYRKINSPDNDLYLTPTAVEGAKDNAYESEGSFTQPELSSFEHDSRYT